MQNSRELVTKAIQFQSPERIPYNFDENRQPRPKDFGDDFIWVFVEENEDFTPSIKGETELGIVYETLDSSFGQPVKHPLADLNTLKSYKLPDFGKPSRYQLMEQKIKEKGKDKYILGMWPHFLFLTCLELCGFEGLMISFYQNADQLHKLIKILSNSCIKVIDRMAEQGVNGIIAIEDLGVQDRLFISPDMWRKFFKPAYQRIFEHAHNKNIHVFMHSCGHIDSLIEDFIEIGLDVIQIDQQDNMGIENLSKKYAGRICFFCPADIQTILTKKDNFENIENRVKELITKLGTPKGGFIAKTYPQPEGIGIPAENTEYMCEMFIKYGNLNHGR